MYNIYFYKDRKGNQPVADYLNELASQNNKDSRIKATKIRDYVKALSLYGTTIGEPYLKHLDGEIWELRPLRDRILFAAWIENSFILLHVFMKKTQKTPKAEIEKAKNEFKDIKQRGL
ncbi:MAG: hypothetical protein DBY32_04815 [Phascolarctobacterium sp.]|nr:MAG: hypothetical protein DBY32_04815 [Phascolarctobacterium sp.]